MRALALCPRAGALLALLLLLASPVGGQIRPRDASDRAALRAWFVVLADAAFYRPADDVVDCAALVRHAVREALRPHTAEWLRRTRLPVARVAPDLTVRARERDGALLLFRISGDRHPRYAEFADAKTIVRYNTRAVGRDVGALAPGDLLYFRQPGQSLPDHLMVFVGRSSFEPEGDDWVVYHTGPSAPAAATLPAAGRGEVRKARLGDLLRHPAPRWRPLAGNPAFVGIFRLQMLD